MDNDEIILHCSIKGCQNNALSVRKIDNITFHRFPDNPKKRKLWIQATGKLDLVSITRNHVCSVHFDKQDFDSSGRIKKLAVPSRHLPCQSNAATLKGNKCSKINKPTDDIHYETSRYKYFDFIAKNNHKKLDRRYYQNVINCLLEGESRRAVQLYNYRVITKEYELLRDSKGYPYVIKRRDNPEKDPQLQCVALEDSFDILIKLHLSNKHANRDRMHILVKDNYIINEMYIDFMLMSCSICSSTKMSLRPRSYKPDIHNEIHKPLDNHKKIVFIDIIDLQNLSDGPFKFIFVYQEIASSFILLRPLVAKCFFEVATELMKILTSFGPPKIFILDQDHEGFYTSVKEHLGMIGFNTIIPFKMVPRVELPYVFYIQKCIRSWMRESGTENWAIGCHIIQWRLNNDKIHPDILLERDITSCKDGGVGPARYKKSPHLSVFGNVSNMQSIVLPVEKDNKITIEVPSSIKDTLSNTYIYKEHRKRKLPKNQGSHDTIEVVVLDGEELIPKVVSKKINDDICHICECNVVLQACKCDVCHKSVHVCCSEKSTLSSPNTPVYTCFSCTDLVRL